MTTMNLQPCTKIYNAALYMRLSKDDDNYGDSISIESQRKILNQFRQAHPEFHIVGEFVDDGWSGTNFNRPDFQRMIGLVEEGEIDAILTTDLSRFGREHIMMDYYLEIYFPERRVRYVAVTENEDTEKGLSDFVPFKNLFNEWYAKDTSRKIKAAFKAKYLAGEYVAPIAPFGYIKNPDVKNTIIIDREYSWIVIKMFDLAYHGMGSSRIRNLFLAEKVPTPGYINYLRSGAFAQFYANAPEERAYCWSLQVIRKILKDEAYIGNTIHLKKTTISYKNHRMVKRPESEWIRVERTHEPLISEEVFWRVQELIESRRRETKYGDKNIFAGLLKCADCGNAMILHVNRQRKNPRVYLRCGGYSRSWKKCTPHLIRYEVVYAFVISRLQYWTKQVQQNEEKLLEQLMKSSRKEQAAAQKKQVSELKKVQKRKAEVDGLFLKIYEDWAAERITEYNFRMLSEKYQKEQVELDAKVQQLQKEVDAARQETDDAAKWVSLMKQYTNPTELTAEMLNVLIEKILVHNAVKDGDGTKTQKIEIYYRFIGKLD